MNLLPWPLISGEELYHFRTVTPFREMFAGGSPSVCSTLGAGSCVLLTGPIPAMCDNAIVATAATTSGNIATQQSGARVGSSSKPFTDSYDTTIGAPPYATPRTPLTNARTPQRSQPLQTSSPSVARTSAGPLTLPAGGPPPWRGVAECSRRVLPPVDTDGVVYGDGKMLPPCGGPFGRVASEARGGGREPGGRGGHSRGGQ
jgi:hypothetical protein